jgi:hypothetical protein
MTIEDTTSGVTRHLAALRRAGYRGPAYLWGRPASVYVRNVRHRGRAVTS